MQHKLTTSVFSNLDLITLAYNGRKARLNHDRGNGVFCVLSTCYLLSIKVSDQQLLVDDPALAKH